ncbi:MAG: hypothetical protein ACLQVA_17475 [Candidatus Brocadiia bacterium]
MNPAPLDEQARTPAASGMLLVCILAVAAPLTHWGGFTWEGLVLLIGAAALALFLHVRPQAVRVQAEPVLLGMVIAFLAVICCLSNGESEVKFRYRVPGFPSEMLLLNPFGQAIKIVAAGALMAVFTYLFERVDSRRAARVRFCLIVAAAVAMRILMLFSSPAPVIYEATDVFRIQTDVARAFFEEGKNGYTLKFKERVLDLGGAAKDYGLPYPPTAVYPPMAFWYVFRDVRTAWIACDLAAALMIYLVARRMSPGRSRFHELAAAAFLFMPRSLFVLENGWTEPLMAAALGGLALALAAARGPFLTGCLMGVWLTSKQYVVLAVPLLIRLRRASANTWLWAALVGIVLTLPFILWDFGALVGKTVRFFVESPGRADSLSIYGALARQGVELPAKLSVGIWLLAMAWLTWKMPRTLAGWLFSMATSWLVFFLLGKQAFINYYYFISFTLLLAVAASPAAADRPKEA